MKRFLLFEFPEFYPSGGISDVVAEFDTYEEASKYIADRFMNLGFSDSAYLFDCEERKIVWDKYAA